MTDYARNETRESVERALAEQIVLTSRMENRARRAEFTLARLRNLMEQRRTHKFLHVRVSEVLDILDSKDLLL